MRPCRERNAISSSYSSMGGFPWLKRRRGQTHPTAISSETVSEDNSQAVSQAVIHTPGERAADAAPGEKLAPGMAPPLLRPLGLKKVSSAATQARGASDAAALLKLGFRVTAEDLDPEKEAALVPSTVPCGVRPRSSGTAEPHGLPKRCPYLQQGLLYLLSPKHPAWMHSRRHTKSQDSLGCLSLLASAAGAPSLPAVSGRKRRSAGPLSPSCHLFTLLGHSPGHLDDSSPFSAPSVNRSLRSPRPGASAAAAMEGPLPPLQGTPRRGPHRMERKEAPHIPELSPSCSRCPVCLSCLSQQQKREIPNPMCVHFPVPFTQGPLVSTGPLSPALQIAASGSGSSSAASTSAHLAPKAASRSDAPQAHHSLRKGHHQPGRTEGLWSQPSTETSSTQPKPAVLRGQQQGTRTLKRSLLSSNLAAPAAAPASSAARQPAQGTRAHSAAGVSSPATCTSGPPTEASRPGLLAQLGPFLRHLLPLPVRCMLPFTRCLCQN
ncbi:LOW QUALITY PROTEIN: putative POM121-like protein 1 [Plecturocebus cupreus]